MDRSRRSVSSRLVALQRDGRIPYGRHVPDVPKGRAAWTSQDDDQLFLWREQRIPVRECAERLGRSDKAVTQRLSVLKGRRRRTLTASSPAAVTTPAASASASASASVTPQQSAVAGPSQPPVSSDGASLALCSPLV